MMRVITLLRNVVNQTAWNRTSKVVYCITARYVILGLKIRVIQHLFAVQYFTFLATVCILWNKIVRGCCVITTSNKNGYKKIVWTLLSMGILNCVYVLCCHSSCFKIWLLWHNNGRDVVQARWQDSGNKLSRYIVSICKKFHW